MCYLGTTTTHAAGKGYPGKGFHSTPYTTVPGTTVVIMYVVFYVTVTVSSLIPHYPGIK